MPTTVRNLIYFIIWSSLAIQISSCKKCEPYRSSKQLSEEIKAFVPGNVGDTLKFKDLNGKKYNLVCISKSVTPTGYTSTGHNNECDDSYMSWDYLQANYSGYLISDKGEPIELMIRINDPGYAYDSVLEKNNNNCTLRSGRPPLYLKFSSFNSAQAVKGFLEGASSPILKNFEFRSLISLNGKQMQNIYIQSVEHPGAETICPSTKNSAIGIDSVYYSTQYGIIRLTTVGGKKYQRVL